MRRLAGLGLIAVAACGTSSPRPAAETRPATTPSVPSAPSAPSAPLTPEATIPDGAFVVLDDGGSIAPSLAEARAASPPDPRLLAPTLLAEIVHDHGDVLEVSFPGVVDRNHCTRLAPLGPPTESTWFVAPRRRQSRPSTRRCSTRSSPCSGSGDFNTTSLRAKLAAENDGTQPYVYDVPETGGSHGRRLIDYVVRRKSDGDVHALVGVRFIDLSPSDHRGVRATYTYRPTPCE